MDETKQPYYAVTYGGKYIVCNEPYPALGVCTCSTRAMAEELARLLNIAVATELDALTPAFIDECIPDEPDMSELERTKEALAGMTLRFDLMLKSRDKLMLDMQRALAKLSAIRLAATWYMDGRTALDNEGGN